MVGRVFLTQILITAVAAGLGLAWNVVAAYSALLGGLVATVVSAYFVRRAFAEPALDSASRMVATMYRAEIAKLALAAVLFATVFALVTPLNAVAFLASFGVVYMSVTLVLLGGVPRHGARGNGKANVTTVTIRDGCQ